MPTWTYLSVAEPGFEPERLGSKANVLSFCSVLFLICAAGGGADRNLPLCLLLSLTSFF